MKVKVIRKANQTLLLKVIGFVCSYFFTLIVTKRYGVGSQGAVSLMFAILGFFTMVSLKGSNIYMTKVVAKTNNIFFLRKIYWSLFFYYFLLSIFISLIIFLINNVFADYSIVESRFIKVIFNIIAIVFFPSILLGVNSAVLRGMKKTNLYTLFTGNIGKFFLPLVLTYSVLHNKNEFYPLYYISFTIILLSLFTTFYILREIGVDFSLVDLKKKKRIVISFFSNSYPMMLNSMAFFLLGWIDTLIIGFYFGEIDLGYYSVALKLSLGASFTHSAISTVLAPTVANLWREKRYNELQREINISKKYILVSSLFIVTVLLIFSKTIMGFFGTDFSSYHAYLIILLFGQLFSAISGPVGIVLDMTGYQKKYTQFLAIAVVFNVFSNLILINFLGIIGVCISTSISYFVWNSLAVRFVSKQMNLKTSFVF